MSTAQAVLPAYLVRGDDPTVTADAVRALVIGGPTTAKVITAVVWCMAITAVFAALAVRRYRQAA